MSTQQFQRIPQSFIDTLLDRVDIVDVVDSRVKLKRSGRNYTACCPFHKEKTPSFSVVPDKQFYYCFGCGAGGNAIGFLMDLEHLNFPEAVEELARRTGLDVPRQESLLSPQEIAVQQVRANARKRAYELLDQANQFYQQSLRQDANRAQAIAYLKARGLTGTIAKRFGMGFAPPGWQNLIDHVTTKPSSDEVSVASNAHGYATDLISALVDNGLVVKKEGSDHTYDFFRERIMFPIRNSKGQVVAFGGRVLGDAKPKYLNSPETAVFQKERELYGLYEARQQERNLQRILVVEGYMDVVALAQSGIHNAVATLGTATSQFHLERIFKQVKEVVFCFDGDAAGLKAAVRAMHTCVAFMSDGRQARFLLLPQGHDPDSLVREEGQEKFNKRIVAATPFSDFLFDHFAGHLDVSNLEHRAQLVKELWPIIGQMPKGVMKSLMQARLEQVSGLSQAVIEDMIDEHPQAPYMASVEPPKSSSSAIKTDHSADGRYGQSWPSEFSDITGGYGQSDATVPVEHYDDFAGTDDVFVQTASLQPWSNTHTDKKVPTNTQAAIRLVLKYPHVAAELPEIPDHLLSLRDPSAKLLVALLEIANQVHNQIGRHLTEPEMHAECRDWAEWDALESLAAMESLDIPGDEAVRFLETIDQLKLNHVDQCFEELIEKMNGNLSEQEKAAYTQQLNALIEAKRNLANRAKK